MPKENTHIFIADKVLKSIDDVDIKSVISSNQKEYYLGAFFPDIFHYSFKFHDIGRKLHGADGEKTNKMIFLMLDHQKNNPKEKDLAFLFGYITHCAADIIFHPIVCYLSGNYYDKDKENLNNVRYRHNRIETYIDVKLSHSFYIDRLTSVGLINNLNVQKIIAQMFDKDEKGMKIIIKKCLRRMLFLNWTYRYCLAYYFVRFLIGIKVLKKMGERGVYYSDVKNQQVLPDEIIYTHPVTGKKQKTTVNKMVDESVSLSVDMVVAAKKYLDNKISIAQCNKIINGASLETGMVDVGFNEMKYFS